MIIEEKSCIKDKTSCNFCTEDSKNYDKVITFIRNEGNAFQATICEKCLKELLNFYIYKSNM